MDHNPWPNIVRGYRKEQGLKQTALASILGVNQSTVSRWERGIEEPTVGMQRRFRDMVARGQVVDPIDVITRLSQRPVALLKYEARARGRNILVLSSSRGIAEVHQMPNLRDGYRQANVLASSESKSDIDQILDAAEGIVSGVYAHVHIAARYVTLAGVLGTYYADWIPVVQSGERLILANWDFEQGEPPKKLTVEITTVAQFAP